ncbi:IS1380 family transposase, partial [Actinokineospora sp.]|uniref:IS1380 family transposase n=1 Tax=Actinokineospora sp. TaxID=1872133 RepID=UPI003D6AB4EA
GGSRFTYTHVRGYHPLLATAAASGEVLHSKLRGGPSHTARGARRFLTETFTRVRAAGHAGALCVRADSGFYNRRVVGACDKAGATWSITTKMSPKLLRTIEQIPEESWTDIPYFLDEGAQVAETSYQPFGGTRAVRLIVRRVRPTPDSQLALLTVWSHHAFITNREGQTLDLEADHRRHAECENAIRDLKEGVGLCHMPSGRFGANAAWLALATIAHNLSRWVGAIGLLEETFTTTRTLRRRYFRVPARLTRSARRATLHPPARWPWATQFLAVLTRLRAVQLLT